MEVYVIVFAICALYVLGAYILMNMAHLMEIKCYWIALIPLLQLYIIGKMIQTIDLGGIQVKYPEYILPITWVGILGLLGIFYFDITIPTWIALLLMCIFVVIWLYGLQTFFLTFGCSEKKSMWFTMIGGILLIPLPLFIILIRNNEPQYEEFEVVEKRKKNPNKKRRSGKNKNH